MNNEGIREPLPIQINLLRKGLGCHIPKLDVNYEKDDMDHERDYSRAIDKNHIHESTLSEFKSTQRETVYSQRISRDFTSLQNIMEQLRELYNTTPPHNFQQTSNDSEEYQFERMNADARNIFYYCLWCGCAFNDKLDLEENCPGNTFDCHEN